MNNPSDIVIDLEDQVAWLKEHKATTGLSWGEIGGHIGCSGSTLSVIAGGKYKGRVEEYAKQIFRYRQTLVRQSQLKAEAPEIPTYFETATSKHLMNMLAWAQRGRMTFCAGGPGIGKTRTAEEYQARAANVWLITCTKSMDRISSLGHATLAAMGNFNSRGSKYQLTLYIREQIRQRAGGLLIFDDAQHLPYDLIEEIRGWYDQTGVGVALLGNEDVVSRMEGGQRKAAFAQLYSRVGMRMIQQVARPEDIETLADEWRIHDRKIVDFLLNVGQKPGSLRTCTHALEIAAMIAKAEDSEMTRQHLTSAWQQLNKRPIAA